MSDVFFIETFFSCNESLLTLSEYLLQALILILH